MDEVSLIWLATLGSADVNIGSLFVNGLSHDWNGVILIQSTESVPVGCSLEFSHWLKTIKLLWIIYYEHCINKKSISKIDDYILVEIQWPIADKLSRKLQIQTMIYAV